ncbi:MAG: hypothetical protein MJZ31_09610 [Bacteroidales bacterium]|nr:hypothetical protein [Bacteroidales bacterium]
MSNLITKKNYISPIVSQISLDYTSTLLSFSPNNNDGNDDGSWRDLGTPSVPETLSSASMFSDNPTTIGSNLTPFNSSNSPF